MRRFTAGLLGGFAALTLAAAQAPEGEFEASACLECHQRLDPELVAAWQASKHAVTQTTVGCAACHGNTHTEAAARARRDSACIECHGGGKNPVVHSYATSKHGILMRLEQDEWDWSQPLESANYRAPGCAYCHIHGGNHNVSAGVRAWNPREDTDAAERERVQDALRVVCQDCHAPRYITRLFDNGERMLAIGRMKVREAAAALAQAGSRYGEAELAAAHDRFEKMQSLHLKNVYLGVGHQSPDYQWWHGQPALDGDLLRIKGTVGELRRMPKKR
jgi:Seven times multi-haem cytochrome CxxCH